MPGRRGRGSWLVVGLAAALLLVPLVLGVALGWYGLNGPSEERLEPVGAFAHELLSGVPDGHLVVEIAFPPGEPPPASAVSTLWSRMNETLQKSSISFDLETYATSMTGPWTTDALFSLEDGVRTTWPTIGTMSLFYLFVPGSFADSGSVIGLAYAGSSIAVFPQVVQANGGTDPTAILTTVMVHEFGHELGLVGVVGSAPNEDPNHPGHSDDPNDVMYWQVETTAVLGGILGGSAPPTQFDAQDLADLGTVRVTVIGQEVVPWVVLGVAASAAVAALVVGRRVSSARKPKV